MAGRVSDLARELNALVGRVRATRDHRARRRRVEPELRGPRRLGLRRQPPAPTLEVVGADALAHHAHVYALFVAAVLAPVAAPLVHNAVV